MTPCRLAKTSIPTHISASGLLTSIPARHLLNTGLRLNFITVGTVDAVAEVPGQADNVKATPEASAAIDPATREVIGEQGEQVVHGNSASDAIVADISEPDQVYSLQHMQRH